MLALDGTLFCKRCRIAEEAVQYLENHDALAGLPNRQMFKDYVNRSIEPATDVGGQVAVLLIDLDHFKDINDSQGHQCGDLLLVAASERVLECLHETEWMARLGGDEFAISLPTIADRDYASAVANRILALLREPFTLDEQSFRVTGSIGISIYPADGRDAQALMRAADTALYHAKSRGRDTFEFYTPHLNDVAQRRHTNANRLHLALQRREFTLHFQPQVEMESGRIFSAEALIRWQQPDLGLDSVSDLISVAEQTGLIVALGEWVLRDACEQLKKWRDAGFTEMRIAVNVSPLQLSRPGFHEIAASVLYETGLPAEALELEITEGTLMMQSKENVQTLECLARMGIRLSVDDFGTGYSNLSYLKRFPLNALKIDQSFVSGIEIDRNDTAIVRAIIAMASSLNLTIVAEGVETAEQVNFLKSLGCKSAQGFFYGKAVPGDAFTELLCKQQRPLSICLF